MTRVFADLKTGAGRPKTPENTAPADGGDTCHFFQAPPPGRDALDWALELARREHIARALRHEDADEDLDDE